MRKNDESRQTFFTGSILTFLLVALIVAAIGGTWWFLDYTKDDGCIYPNVFAMGLDLSGMTPEEAASALHAHTDTTFTAQNMTVQLPDRVLTLTPGETGARLDVDALVQLAYSYGRGGNRWENTQAKAQAALEQHELDVSGCLTLDLDHIRLVVDQAASAAARACLRSRMRFSSSRDLRFSFSMAVRVMPANSPSGSCWRLIFSK